MTTLTIEMQNRTCAKMVWCWVMGYDIERNNKLLLISSDGVTPYYPPSPAADTTCQPLMQDCAIPIGLPGASIFITVPHISGCRIYFSVNDKLTFMLSPGPAIVEPSCTNKSDPNINIIWDFVELTFTSAQAFANISYVDFVCLPVALTMTSQSGKAVDHVSGLPLNGLRNICNALKAQSALDGQP
jgi:hypothetical protein